MRAMSVLVVDDVPEICDLVANFLEPLGHAVKRAESGREAVKVFRQHPCDLVITDVLMPDGDGLELIGELQRTTENVRILAISGGGASLGPGFCVSMAKALGAHATLTKPFDRNQLLDGIRNALVTHGP